MSCDTGKCFDEFDSLFFAIMVFLLVTTISVSAFLSLGIKSQYSPMQTTLCMTDIECNAIWSGLLRTVCLHFVP
ncbi:hypothetical protein Sjap_024328 [Stephania japonica]|uniref:Uncharacterized protein n=1 Tax=Stephania japonica TaxID=461633 RepID=A0AAP0ED74_9MAGN